MAGRPFISRFSPNRTDPKVLEAILVQRHALADAWLERLRQSVLGGATHHLLAVGPRGCGKSHLVVLLLSRLKSDPVVSERVRIAWLPEHETTTSFWKFLLRILRALNAEYGDEFPPPPRAALENADDDRRTAVLTDHLLKKPGTRTLLVVVENLDDALRGLKLEGQKRWRAFLQKNPAVATLATAQQLTTDVSDRDRPFLDVFQIERLQPLTADEALELLRELAEQSGRAALAAFLQTATGRARVRAIRHIAGGNHLVFITLSRFATRENLDDLVRVFEELLDELTPYYQERLRWLPDQQREIVEFLCRQTHTVAVKEIATELFLSDQAAAAQLKSLKDKGYVTAESFGRESRYELSEPLMRLCMKLKDPHSDSIGRIGEFLRIWYDRAGAEERIHRLRAEVGLEPQSFYAVPRICGPAIPRQDQEDLNRDLQTARATVNPQEVVRVLVELAATAATAWQVLAAAGELRDLGRHEEALAAYDRAIELDPENADSWNGRGCELNEHHRHEEALAAYERATELDPRHSAAWNNLGWTLNRLGRQQEALGALGQSMDINPTLAVTWINRGRANLNLDRTGDALDDLYHALALGGACTEVFEMIAIAEVFLGRWDQIGPTLFGLFRIPLLPDLGMEFSYLPILIAAIFGTSTDRIVWAQRIARLAKAGEEARNDRQPTKAEPPTIPPRGSSMESSVSPNPLTVIGDALVRSLTAKVYTEATADALNGWETTWRETAKRHSDLSLAVRLFEVGLRYVHTNDERILLDLVSEERSILRPLFRIVE